MQPAQPSRTAFRVALRRAAHQLVDARPLILEDPFAIRILGPHAEELDRTPNGRGKLRLDSAALRAWLVVRSRYAEETLATAVQSGVTQYVLLGAGLDTFALRNPYSTVRVFEVDHPATQAWKRALLHAAALPEAATFVPVDFETQSLAAQLADLGHDATRPTVFAWLGVVVYLTLETFRGTLAFIAAQPHGTAVVLDYAQPRHCLRHDEQLARDSLTARVAQVGEPFQLFFTPDEIAHELHAFRLIEDLGTTELNARYFGGRTDHLQVLGSSGRLLSAYRE